METPSSDSPKTTQNNDQVPAVSESQKKLASPSISSVTNSDEVLRAIAPVVVQSSFGSTTNLIEGMMASYRDSISQSLEPLRKLSSMNTFDVSASFAPLMPTLEAINGMQTAMQSVFREALYGTRTNSGDYAKPDKPKSSYSHHFTSIESYFEDREGIIDSFEELNAVIAELVRNTKGLRLVWRGQANAAWGIHSGLYRELMEVNGVKADPSSATGEQPFPTEEQMILAERRILAEARTNWRFDGMSALETLARIQHEGGITRLLDVTKNPYIAAWFAIGSVDDLAQDGRLIAFATTPVTKADKKIDDKGIELDVFWGGHELPWHLWLNDEMRQEWDWGTGANRRVWVPPAYHDRIAAQNAAFLLDGVPITSGKVRDSLKASNGKRWSRADILAASSVISKIFRVDRVPKPNSANLAPTFTFRIKAEAKREIRALLESQFGYTHSYVYPDMSAFAQYTRSLALPSLTETEELPPEDHSL